MRDAHLASLVFEAQHEDAVPGRQAGDARDERRVAVELDAGGVDRGFGVRRGHDRRELARERAAWISRTRRSPTTTVAIRCAVTSRA